MEVYTVNHYESLGVDQKATPDQIKAAYRSKAREKHPDKGGSSEDFAPIAKAYEVLSDPERRLLYDTTGGDHRPPIEIEVQNALLAVINQALSQPDGTPIIELAKRTIQAVQAESPGQIKKLKARKARLEARRGKISSAGAMNLVHMVIDGELKGIEARLAQLEHEAVLHTACLDELGKYTETVESEAPARHRGTYSVTFNTWNG